MNELIRALNDQQMSGESCLTDIQIDYSLTTWLSLGEISIAKTFVTIHCYDNKEIGTRRVIGNRERKTRD